MDGRIRKVQAGVLGLLLRQRGRLSAPREEAFVLSLFFPLRYFARETAMSKPGHITITNGRKTHTSTKFLSLKVTEITITFRRKTAIPSQIIAVFIPPAAKVVADKMKDLNEAEGKYHETMREWQSHRRSGH